MSNHARNVFKKQQNATFTQSLAKFTILHMSRSMIFHHSTLRRDNTKSDECHAVALCKSICSLPASFERFEIIDP